MSHNDVLSETYCLYYRALAGKGQLIPDICTRITRAGYLEDVYTTMSLNPIFTEDGKIAGMINISLETTITVLTTRRQKTIRDLSNGTQCNYLGIHVINSNDYIKLKCSF